MNPAPTLSIAPLEHPSMDYAFLRQEGIRHLERMAGQLWTDFNVHDPGITILEQVCYAITDLGYRIAYDLPDLLAGDGVEPSRSLFSPGQILPSYPVTLSDLRKLVLDVDGVKNAWIEPVTAPGPYLPLYYFAAGTREMRLRGEERTASPVALKGLYHVLIATSDLPSSFRTVVERGVTRHLHAHRNLCEDFAEIRVLDPQPIQIQACIEIDSVEDVEHLWLDICQRIAAYISPAGRFYTLSELLAAGKPIDEIFEGPLLEHGFIDNVELAQTRTRRTALRTSDLIREIMDVAGVRAVRTISLAADNTPQPWSLTLDLDRVPALDIEASDIRLERNRVTVYAQRLAHIPASHARARAERDLPLPAGRDRNVGTYYALQHQFPAAYGIGEMGLPASATLQRQAQAKQLKAYLMFFDQLLANYFAQLAHVKELFAFSGNAAHTYVARMIDDPTLGVDEIRVQDPATYRTTLQKLTEDESTALRRRHRFLNHLLARFAEQFTDYALVLYGMSREDSTTAKKLLQDKQTFLRRYPHISSARGTACNYLLPRSRANSSGLEQRIRLKLGIAEQDEEAFYLVEHILLRPMADDTPQQVPLLAQARHKDPYSLQLSFVFPNYPPRFQDPHFKTFIEQTVREETPAHLIPYMHWLDEGAMTTFVRAYKDWLDTRRHYWTAPLGDSTMATIHIHVRDARDRLIDLLGIGQTYPLQDLAVRDEQLTVAFNTAAHIPIANSQKGVLYQLHERDNTLVTRTPAGAQGEGVLVQAEGTGDTILLETYKIQEDVTFKIHARKLQSGREAYLHQTATVKVGLDVTLQAWIRVEPAGARPAPTAPHIIANGTDVEVEISNSQEGVDYHLVAATTSGPATEEVLSVASMRGNLHNIILRTRPLYEDTDLRIRATKTFDPSEHRPTETALLESVLPLKVGANPALQVSVASSIIDFQQSATVTIAGTQQSAQYTIYMRPIPDRDFVYPPDPPAEVLIVPVAGKPDVQVRKPARGDVWSTLPGYTAASAPQPGTGGTLTFTTPALTHDSLLIVQAFKAHQAPPGVSSAIQLEQAAVILVRPNPAPALRLVPVEPAATSGAFQVFDGQPGVFYYFRREPEGTALGLPVYFHKKDDTDQRVNKGIDQLRIGIDFVVAPTLPADQVQTTASLAEVPPAAPILETGALPVGTVCSVWAVKAQTGVEVELAQPIRLGP